MANVKISALTALTAANATDADLVPVVSSFSGAATTYKMTTAQLRAQLSEGAQVFPSGGVTVTAGGLIVTAGGLTVSAGTTAVQALTATTGTFSAASTGAITASGGSIISTASAIVSRGTIDTGHVASQFAMDYSAGSRLLCYGPNGSTNGILTIASRRSDGTNALNLLVSDTAGAIAFAGAVSGITTLSCTTVTATNLGGTLSTAAQPNITSVGILVSPHMTGAVVDSGGLTVTTGGVTVTGASTITGTLGGITTLTATTFSGALSGNATTATALQTARTINGTSFDGTANVTVTAAAGTLTGATLAAAVTASSLTSVGTLASLTVSGSTQTASGSTSCLTGVATTIFSPTIGTDAVYLISLTVTGLTGAAYGVAFVSNSTLAATAQIQVGVPVVSITASGGNVQVTQSSGSTQTIAWSYLRFR